MYTVTQVAKQLSITAETIRYYTREGLIIPRRDSNNGYRYYSDRDVQLVEFVRKAKQYGLTLHEIREVLKRFEIGESPCPYVRETVINRYQQTREKIKELRALEARLERALTEWDLVEDDGSSEGHICPLIEKPLAD